MGFAWAFGLALAMTAACGPSAPPAPPPVTALPVLDTTPRPKPSLRPIEAPPPPGAPLDVHLPAASFSELPGGLTVGTLPLTGLPLAEVRVVIAGGRAAEGDRPGAAELLAELLKRGASEVEPLGARLDVEAGDDAIIVRVGVPSAELDAALGKVARALSAPRFERTEVEKIRRRLTSEAADAMREDGDAAAEWMLRRALFSGAGEPHPYGRAGATPGELEKLANTDVRAFHKKTFTPANTFVLIAGAIDAGAALKSAAKAFSDYRGKAARAPLPAAVAPPARRVIVVHIPKAERSKVLVGFLGPRPLDGEYAAFAVVERLLGAKGTGRLFTDVRETRSLAYTARTFTTELSSGPQVFIAYADTQTAKTGQALAAVLENIERIGKEAAPELEVDVGRQAARGALAAKLRTMADVADAVSDLKRMGLSAEYPDQYRRAIDAVTPEAVRGAAAHSLDAERETIVVAGDADEIATMLAKFGAVDVVDLTKGFVTVRRVDAAAQAPAK
jgi:zinc protease